VGASEKEKSIEKKIPVADGDKVQGRHAETKERRSTRKLTTRSGHTTSQRMSTMETVSQKVSSISVNVSLSFITCEVCFKSMEQEAV
jgi:hypothetical protein